MLVEAFDKHFCHGDRGTLLNDIASFCSAYDISGPNDDEIQEEKLQEPLISLLKNHIERNLKREVKEIRDRVIFHKSIVVRGVSYHKYKHSAKDCYVIIGDIQHLWSAYRIEDIFRHTSNPNERNSTTATYFVLRKYKELNQTDFAQDVYRQFPIVGGGLFYNEFEEELELKKSVDILCHFALTPFSKDDINMRKDCIHALPIDRVRT